MTPIKRICPVSGKNFLITDEDLAYYKKMGAVPPTLCPEERARRRFAWRGKNLYMRNCDKCQKPSMSWYSSQLKNITAYCEECYRPDSFDATHYGLNYDFNRPFFVQFAELLSEVPRHISNAISNENSEFIVSAHRNKNCYFADEIDFSQDCYFGFTIQKCKNIVEGLYVLDSEIGYDLVMAEQCYRTFFSKNIYNCSDAAFLMNCRNVRNSLFCTNLRNKEYHLFNQAVTKEEFQKWWDYVFSGSRQNLEGSRKRFEDFLKDQFFPAITHNNAEHCTGDYLTNCKNVQDSFCVDNAQDCRYCTDIHHSRDCYDVNIYSGERMMECLHAGPKSYNLFYSILLWFSSDIYYSIELHSCKNLFGCVGLKQEQYCILNKKYSQKEYESLLPKIIEHMKSTGEWGEFFPVTMSPYPYNQTFAQQFYPLTKEEVQQKEFKWLDEPESIKGEAKQNIPDDPSHLPPDITKHIFTCSQSGKKFRFTQMELNFYKHYHLPLPTLCPQARLERLWSKMPRKLYDRTCSKTGIPLQTTIAPEQYEKVYSPDAYYKEVYHS